MLLFSLNVYKLNQSQEYVSTLKIVLKKNVENPKTKLTCYFKVEVNKLYVNWQSISN